MSDEGFHEIQLNGKQLVFLFMAGIVVSVVIFLCGVMVGRGVRQPALQLAAAAAEVQIDPTATVPAAPANMPTDRMPVSTQESLTYAERLESPVPTPETLKEPEIVSEPAEIPPDPPVETAATAARDQEAAPEPQAAAADAGASFAEPSGNGWAVQVGAYPRSTADAIAGGLAAKGFPSFITPRERGLFAVRVGKFNDRREAEAVARRLEQDEQFKNPWLTR